LLSSSLAWITDFPSLLSNRHASATASYIFCYCNTIHNGTPIHNSKLIPSLSGMWHPLNGLKDKNLHYTPYKSQREKFEKHFLKGEMN
jgi:hypothetical protein